MLGCSHEKTNTDNRKEESSKKSSSGSNMGKSDPVSDKKQPRVGKAENITRSRFRGTYW